ncbi:EF-P lysine aminoacylase GenX [Candidatus Uhrbacteria bacterium]|nr:EF-P lysine aminoacylase GenX [Candidatus Uhrbacteria bacterium]
MVIGDQKHRARVRETVRAYFSARGYLEVETQTLVPSPDTSPTFSYLTSEVRHHGRAPQPMALITSPEYALKKLVAAGEKRVFELARVFRNDEPIDALHSHEFTMLEWYRLNTSFEEGLQETLDFLETVARGVVGVPEAFVNGRHISLNASEAKIFTVEQLFATHVDISDLRNPSRELYEDALRRHDLAFDAEDTISDLFQRLFLNLVEPVIRTIDQIVVVSYYPRHESALARINAQGFAERFEVYIGGVELCNAYGELTDAVEQRRRFEEESAERTRLGKDRFPMDEELLAVLPLIVQPLFGNAVGFDRLVDILQK